MTTFSEVQIGQAFYIREQGYTSRFVKVSDTEAEAENGVITEFSKGYVVLKA